MRPVLLFLLLLFSSCNSISQEDANTIRSIYDEALTDRTIYENLRYLTKNFKGRIASASEANNIFFESLQI